jgi:hypothetical protein
LCEIARSGTGGLSEPRYWRAQQERNYDPRNGKDESHTPEDTPMCAGFRLEWMEALDLHVHKPYSSTLLNRVPLQADSAIRVPPEAAASHRMNKTARCPICLRGLRITCECGQFSGKAVSSSGESRLLRLASSQSIGNFSTNSRRGAIWPNDCGYSPGTPTGLDPSDACRPTSNPLANDECP